MNSHVVHRRQIADMDIYLNARFGSVDSNDFFMEVCLVMYNCASGTNKEGLCVPL